MEKICLARRRIDVLHPREIEPPRREPEEEVISVGLTQEQCRLIRLEGFRSMERLPGSVSLDLHENESGQIVFNFHFRRSEPVRMLKPEHVRQMLQIGSGTLTGLIRSGRLNCFRIGRSRRFLLADVLALLSASGEKEESVCEKRAQAGS